MSLPEYRYTILDKEVMNKFHEKDGETKRETIEKIKLYPVGGVSYCDAINNKEPTYRIYSVLDTPVANGAEQEQIVKESENENAQQRTCVEV